jgi:hypothetical protein
MKNKIVLGLVFIAISMFSQEKDNVTGGLESNAQRYLNDKGLEFSQPDSPIRSNNYIFINYLFIYIY